ncbi:MAG: aldehyde dehydrogenase family protein, partial [Arcobacter sp.]
MKKVQHYINGQFIDSQCGEFFDNFNPATAELISKVALGREAEVNAAVAAAKAALTGEWGQMKLNDRVALMYEVADEINRRFDDFLEAECLDTGKPYSIARHIDIPRGGANFKVFADTMKSYADEAYRADTPDGKKMLNYSMRKPKGVIAVISPWNLPLLLMTWKVGPAMACGNSVVVKPSQVTPTTTSLLGEVMSKVGVPAGAYNVVQGKGSITGNLLTAHKDIDAI